MRVLLTVAWFFAATFLAWHAIAYQAPAIEQDILARSTQAVKALNPQAEIFADGRFVTVRGQAPDDLSKASTLAAAGDVWGSLGPVDQLMVAAPAPFVVAEKTIDGPLRLSGSGLSETMKTAVESAARQAFGAAVDSRLTATKADAKLAEGLEDAFAILADLDRGTLLAEPARLLIAGGTSDTAKAAAARQRAITHTPAIDVFLSEAGVSPPRFNAVKLPDGTILASGDVSSEAARSALLSIFREPDPDRRIVDRLTVRGDDMPPVWATSTERSAKALTQLDWGSVSLDGSRAYLEGMAGADEIAAISESLGSDFTAELTPRAGSATPSRLSSLERALDAAKSRILDLSAASAKHLADLNAAETRADEFRKAEAENKARAEAATTRVAALEATVEQSKRDLETAQARIAGLTEMLSLRPENGQRPADALPAPSPGALGQPAEARPHATPSQAQPTPVEPSVAAREAEPVQSAGLPPPPAPEPPMPEAATSPVEEAERVAAGCNQAINAILGGAAITFESKSAQITREGNDVLDRVIGQIMPCIGNPALKVTVGGHTDSRGQDRDNLRLSKDRADSVKESLIVRSIPPDAITAIGYGETMPLTDNETDEGRAANRRITIDWSLR
jgi:outer membrane protein OmpA-like peptidoglycan-associated protein